MSDINSESVEPLKIIQCNSCVHFLTKKKEPSCLAFAHIPKDIIIGIVSHDKVLAGQKGKFVYEKEVE